MISTLCGVVESEAFNAPRAPRRPEAHSMAERPHLYAARPAPASPSRARSTLGVLTNVIAPSIFIAFKTTLFGWHYCNVLVAVTLSKALLKSGMQKGCFHNARLPTSSKSGRVLVGI